MKIKPVGKMTPPPKVKDLKVGQSGWVVRWAITLDKDGIAVDLNPDAHVHFGEEAQGTARIKITRMGEDEWVVDVTEEDRAQWRIYHK